MKNDRDNTHKKFYIQYFCLKNLKTKLFIFSIYNFKNKKRHKSTNCIFKNFDQTFCTKNNKTEKD